MQQQFSSAYERSQYREAMIAKLLAWLLWASCIATAIWYMANTEVHGVIVNGWVPVGLFFAASWCAATEASAERHLRQIHNGEPITIDDDDDD